MRPDNYMIQREMGVVAQSRNEVPRSSNLASLLEALRCVPHPAIRFIDFRQDFGGILGDPVPFQCRNLSRLMFLRIAVLVPAKENGAIGC